MHNLILIIGVLSALAVWWFRLRMIGRAAGDVGQVAGRMRAGLRRRSARRRAADESLAGIEDPVTGAATVLVAMAADEIPLTPRDEKAIRSALLAVATPEEADGALEYGKWVNTQIDDPAVVIDRLAPLFKARLNPRQRAEFVAVIDTVKKGITYSSRYDEWRDRVIDRLDRVS